jgi:hypothetical protein
MSRKVTIKRTRPSQGQNFDVSFSGLTKGEIMSIQNALKASGSAVASDVLAYLNNGLYDCQEAWLLDLIPND